MKTFRLFLFGVLLQLSAGAQPLYAAIVIQDIQAIDLGTLPGGSTSTARDINNGGIVVGDSE